MTGHQIYDFAEKLLMQSQSLKKRDRTRAAIQVATCRLLDQRSLASLKISDICREAGIAHGTFYIYFSDRQALVVDLLFQYVAHLQTIMKIASKADSADPIRATTAAYYGLFERNPGMMKCLMNNLEEFSTSKDVFQKLNHDWAITVLEATKRRHELSGDADEVSHEELLRRAYALGGMVDQYLQSLFLDQDQTLASISKDKQAVIDTLTHIWKRGMFE